MSKKDDEQLLKWMTSQSYEDREKAFVFIYRNYYKGIASYILQQQGSAEEIEDIFQDAMIVLYNQVQKNAFRRDSTIKTYLYGICRNIWYKKLSKKRPQVQLEGLTATETMDLNMDQLLIGNEREQLIYRLLKLVGEECVQLLKLFYYDNFSMKQIRAHMQLTSEQVAKNKKMKCLKKMRKIVSEDVEYVDLLKNRF